MARYLYLQKVADRTVPLTTWEIFDDCNVAYDIALPTTTITRTGNNYTFKADITEDIAVKRIAWYVWRVNGNCELKDVGLNYTFSDTSLADGDVIEVRVYDPAGLANRLPAGRTAICGSSSYPFYVR